jgi:AbrB family looped-hinge helix DNA binding protein
MHELTMPAISKITAKGQTTVPKEVRTALKSKPGDLIAWEIEPNGRVAVRRIQPLDVEYLQAVQGTLSEWHTAEDEKAYGKL